MEEEIMNTQIKVLEQTIKADENLLLSSIEVARREVTLQLDSRRRALMGQFLTPLSVAIFMADMFKCRKSFIRILDPGAGVGSLSAALIVSICRRHQRPKVIALTTYEIDPLLNTYLHKTLDLCRRVSEDAGIQFEARIVDQDFLEAGISSFTGDLFITGEKERFDCAILNPPYRKIHTKSRERKLLQSIGLETTNLYTGFLAVTAKLLVPGGEMVAITPRSFCNGLYFEPFRYFFLKEMQFRRIHVFDSRNRAFADDGILQENIVFQAIKSPAINDKVIVSSSLDLNDSNLKIRKTDHTDLIRPDDPHLFIRIVPDSNGDSIRNMIEKLDSNLRDLGLAVSTGRIVDFRAKHLLRPCPDENTAPLIYPCHLRGGFVEWPNYQTRKPNAILLEPGAEELFVSQKCYVLVKRFSAKEERRRIVAAVYDPRRVPAYKVAFENHLNYYHALDSELPLTRAKGLAAFLNSTIVDSYFRQFSGHTQVNATDLRCLRYPSWHKLEFLGRRIGKIFPPQDELDRIVKEAIYNG
ncbi:MAG: Eco57I restriction-modification methylase domain-containing protein [bacterium]